MALTKVRKGDPRDGWYRLDPLTAQELLDKQPRNRPLNERKANRWAPDVEAGKWRPNGETIILDENDELLDGQGRCRAVCIAGKPIETYVVHGIPRRYFPSLDTGQPRSGSDTISLAGHKHYVITLSVARIALLVQRGAAKDLSNHVSNEDISNYGKKHKARFEAAYERIGSFLTKSPLSPSFLTYVYMEAAEINEAKAYAWAEGVALGENLRSGSPILVLRERLVGLKGESHKVHRHEKLAWAIKSWNAFYEGRNVGLVRWGSRRGAKNIEAFPVLGG